LSLLFNETIFIVDSGWMVMLLFLKFYKDFLAPPHLENSTHELHTALSVRLNKKRRFFAFGDASALAA
jgi:hypothetical protein